jgi:hypothetical protein
MPDVPTPPIGLIPRFLYDLFGPSYRTSSYGALSFLSALMVGVAKLMPEPYAKVIGGIGSVVMGTMIGMGLWSARDKNAPPGNV